MSAWKHDDLASDLREYLEGNKAARMIWCDMQLGPAGSPRPDVYALPRSYSKFLPFAYEVKISRSDFQTDVNAGKWQKYYAFASAVVFAVPDGLIKTTELPEGAGLIVRKASTWRLAKAPRVNPVDNLPRTAWMKLLMDGVSRLRTEQRETFGISYLRDRVSKKVLGDEIASLIRERESAKYRIQDEINRHKRDLELLSEQHERERQRMRDREAFAGEQWCKLCDLFGLPHGTNTFAVARKVQEAERLLDSDSRVSDLLAVIDSAQHALTSAKHRVVLSKEAAA